MFRVTLKNILSHKVRFLLTGVAVMLGVAFVSGTLVLTATISNTFNGLFSTIYEHTDAVVRQKAAFGSGFREQRGRIDNSVLASVRSAPGVAQADGTVQGFAQVVDKHNKAVGNPGRGAPTLGFAWIRDRDLSTINLYQGRAPTGPNDLVMDKGTADKTGYKIGDSVAVILKTGRESFTMTGIVKFGSTNSLLGASIVAFTPDTASRVLGQPGQYDSIEVKADRGVSQNQVVRDIRTVLTRQPTLEVLSGKAITKESQNNLKDNLSFFNTFLLVFGGVALLVGSFIIFNTFSILVAQRGREMALLRAIGAVRRQVLSAVIVEALLTGVTASVIGFVGGIGLASGLKGLLSVLGIKIPAGGIVIPSNAVIWSFVTGIVVTTVAAVAPALKASRIPPIAAMRDVAVDRSSTSLIRVMIGALLTTVGVVALVGGLVAKQIAIIGFGMLIIFLGVAILGPVIARPISGLLGAPIRWARGVPGQLAQDNAMRNPKRTSATAAALMIGVALVGLITIFGASARASVSAALDKSMKADYVVLTSGFGQGTIPVSMEPQLRQVPNVTAASGVRQGEMQVKGSVTQLIAVDPSQVNSLFDVQVTKGNLQNLGVGGVAVLDTTASDNNWKLGSTVPVNFAATGKRSLTVQAIYKQNQVGSYIVSIPTYEQNFTEQFDSQIYVKTSDGTNAATRRALEQVTAQYPQTKLQDRQQFKAEQGSQINQFLNLVYVLLMFAIVIAVFGIANTLGLSVIERTHEVGLLRAVGMSRRQLRATIRWESVIVALLGTLLGLVIGVFFGWSMVIALKDQGFTNFSFAPVQLLVIVVLAVAFGMLAAILPARRAAKLDILRAVTTE